MSKKEKPFKLPKHKQPFFSIVKCILRLFYKRPEIINLNDEIKEPAIFVANHSAKSGPMIMELYFPMRTAKWGAHPMLGNYKSRRTYLRDVFYRQKCGYGKVKSSLLASFEAIFSIYIYRGMKFLPTYTDARLAKTLNNSVEVLKDGTNVMIFPEDSQEGYFDVMTKFFSGFVMLADNYYRKTQIDVPVYPVYYHKKANKIIIGKPEYVRELKEQGLKRDDVAERFRQKVTELYFNYVAESSDKN